ncbi:MAG: amidohydrolase [Acidimicrobiales bacterium]|nr:amidohydrolase [Acidimicrobiales bacterium]
MDKVMIVSADGHIGASIDAYRPYVESKYLDAFDTWSERHQAATVERVARKMEKHLVHPPMRPYPTTEQISDPATRTAILDSEGVAAEVVFPGPDFTDEHTVPFKVIIGANPERQDLELEAAGDRAYNRWLADYIYATKPRTIGLANLSCYDMEAAVREVAWARSAGFGGVHVTEADSRLPHYWDEYYEPLWNACVEHALPVHFHGGTGYPEDFRMWQGDPGAIALMWSEAAFWATRPLKFLICGGVLERHPELKVVITETTNGWVPDYLQTLDAQDSLSHLSLKPSEYWQRQCYLGASLLRRTEWPLRNAIGIDHMMFGVDFPHPEGSWLRTLPWLQAVFGDGQATEAELRAVAGENAVRVYGLDRNELASIAERVGPTLDDALSPLPDDLDPALANRGALALA